MFLTPLPSITDLAASYTASHRSYHASCASLFPRTCNNPSLSHPSRHPRGASAIPPRRHPRSLRPRHPLRPPLPSHQNHRLHQARSQPSPRLRLHPARRLVQKRSSQRAYRPSVRNTNKPRAQIDEPRPSESQRCVSE